VSSAASKSALFRASEAPQRSEARLAYLRNRAAASRASETPHETDARLAYQRNTAASSRASESQHDTEARLAYQRNLVAASRASETPLETEARLAYQRLLAAASRARETPLEAEARLAYQRLLAAASRASETPLEAEARLAYQRLLAAASRASETPLDTEARLAYQKNGVATRASVTPADLRLIAFAYNPIVNYHEHPNVLIGNMDAVCSYCATTKWKDEPPGLCCSNRKVQLPPLLPPCEPLKSLMSGCTSDSKHLLQHIRQYNSCFQMTSFGVTKEIGGVHANIQISRPDLSQGRFAAPYIRCRPTILTNLLHGGCGGRGEPQVLQSAGHKT